MLTTHRGMKAAAREVNSGDNVEAGEMRRTARAATLVLAASLVASEISAEPNKVQYELQERCATAASAKFKSAFPSEGRQDTENGHSYTSYQNHYSVTFNKCFILTIINDFAYKGEYKGKHESTYVEELWDVNENKQYGSYYTHPLEDRVDFCEVQNKFFCHSELEWRQLIKPYMED